jgi:uncharacterized phage protein (TIGR02218 family)
MKTISGPLLALLNSSDKFFKADLYTITLSDATVIRVTSADVAIPWGGNTFQASPIVPIINRTLVKSSVGITVDSLNLTITPQSSQTVSGFSWQEAARRGYLDGATILVETAYLTSWPVPVGVMHTFYGLLSGIDISGLYIEAEIKSGLEILNRPFPRNVYQGPCLRVVYSTGCGVLKATFTVTGSVNSSPTVLSIGTSRAEAAGYFNQGVLTFTSGVNNGIKRTIKSFTGGAFTFIDPLPAAPGIGDTFSAFPGCDHTKATCQTKFSNIGKFRGFPYIPTPETTY